MPRGSNPGYRRTVPGRFCRALSGQPRPDDPRRDHALRHERVVGGELLCGATRREHVHRSRLPFEWLRKRARVDELARSLFPERHGVLMVPRIHLGNAGTPIRTGEVEQHEAFDPLRDSVHARIIALRCADRSHVLGEPRPQGASGVLDGRDPVHRGLVRVVGYVLDQDCIDAEQAGGPGEGEALHVHQIRSLGKRGPDDWLRDEDVPGGQPDRRCWIEHQLILELVSESPDRLRRDVVVDHVADDVKPLEMVMERTRAADVHDARDIRAPGQLTAQVGRCGGLADPGDQEREAVGNIRRLDRGRGDDQRGHAQIVPLF